MLAPHGTHRADSAVVRLAELQIDPAQLNRYLGFLREEIETSIRVEPGVLTLYAVRAKDDSTRVRLFEMYADPNAYDAHLASPHFRKGKVGDDIVCATRASAMRTNHAPAPRPKHRNVRRPR